MTTKLKQLRTALETLQTYNLPYQFKPVDLSKSNIKGGNKGHIDPELIDRYENAKSQYLKQRITELLVEHVETFDGTSFQFPPIPETALLEKSKEDNDHICKKVKISAEKLGKSMNSLHAEYENFSQRRDELERMVNEMEAKNESVGKNDMDDSKDFPGNDQDVNEDKMKEQEEKLSTLVRKRLTLQQKLDQLKEKKREMEEKQTNLNGKWAKEKENLKEHVSDDLNETLNNLKRDKEKMKLTINQLKEKTTWYKSITEAFEELGGIKILKVQNVEKNKDKQNRADNKYADDLYIEFLLIDKYSLIVTLSPMSMKQRSLTTSLYSENLAISHAVLRSKSNLKNKNNILSRDHTVTLPIPSITDILPVTHNLPPKSAENLRFLLRETMMRLRATEKRAEELSKLRRKYLTKILKSGQEVVCSLNEGITVVIHLTHDCPIVMGTAFVEEIVGIGGWCEDELEVLKIKVNRKLNNGSLNHHDGDSDDSDGPIISIMNFLVKEIQHLKKPATPKFPLFNKK